MKPVLSLNATESDDGSGYSQSLKLAKAIISEGFVLILLLTITLIGVLLTLTASFPNGKKEALTELVRSQGQMELSENSTNSFMLYNQEGSK